MTPGPDTKGAKDCRTCNRRRIKCDRGLPTCRKCHDRELHCPGYGVPWKWIQGVASRGKQKGQGPDVLRRRGSTPGRNVPLDFSEPSVAPSESSSPPRELLDCEVPDTANLWVVPEISRNPLPVSDFLVHPPVRRLLYHFNHVVAPRLAWADSLDNPWRNIILPLSLESPSLLFSVLALSAGDLAFKSQSDSALSVHSLQISNVYRDKALKLLAEQLKANIQGTGQHAMALDNKPANTDLATTLMLFNLEILQPGSTQWRLHLWAARTMIRRWGNTTHLPNPSDITSNFLVQEFFTTNVCAFMTTFVDTHDMTTDTLNHDLNSVFIDFHRVMQYVTDVERRRVAGNPEAPMDVAFVWRRLEQARQRTLNLGQAMKFSPPKIAYEFEHVVDMYHHMGLIYIHRVLFGGSSPHSDMSLSRDSIFKHMQSLGDSKAFVQDLVWPLFIAGTECRGNPDKQEIVETKLLEVIQLTGPLDRWQVLNFLKAFWAEDDCKISWIDYARAWAQNGSTFVVY